MGDDERIRKLEEGQVFADRTVEELSAEVRALGKRVGELGAAIARLEAKLAQWQAGESDEE